MELGLGVLRWPPEQFWNATTHELYAALDGYAESRSAKRDAPMTHADLAALEEWDRNRGN